MGVICFQTKANADWSSVRPSVPLPPWEYHCLLASLSEDDRSSRHLKCATTAREENDEELSVLLCFALLFVQVELTEGLLGFFRKMLKS